MDVSIRFSALVRQGLRFRKRFEDAKQSIPGLVWYPYDSFASLFYLQRFLRDASLSLPEITGNSPVLDLGAGDGALSFFLESLGHRMHAVDYAGSNINRMEGLRALARHFGSQARIDDLDLDGRFELPDRYGLALFLGALYHLKNPFYALETLARHAHFCFLSTRVARLGPDRQTRLDALPLAYLLDAGELNGDTTNYWIFSPCGLLRLVTRAGWTLCASASSGASASDPSTAEGDERMFLLLKSARR